MRALLDASGRLYSADALSESRQGWLHDSTALLTGTAVSGLLAYAYVVLGTRTYGAVEFAPISVLWTIWAMSAAVITFPVQHWVIRTIEADGTDGTVRAVRPLILAAAVLLSTTIGVLAWLARSTLFSDSGALYPVLAATIPLGSVMVGLTRGTLAARRRFTAAAAAFATENLIRAVAAVIVVLAGWGSSAYRDRLDPRVSCRRHLAVGPTPDRAGIRSRQRTYAEFPQRSGGRNTDISGRSDRRSSNPRLAWWSPCVRHRTVQRTRAVSRPIHPCDRPGHAPDRMANPCSCRRSSVDSPTLGVADRGRRRQPDTISGGIWGDPWA